MNTNLKLMLLAAAFCIPLTAGALGLSLDLGKVVDVVSGSKKTMPVDDKQEVEIGEGMAAKILGTAPLANDDNLQNYVNHLGRWLASQTERADLDWHFGVIETPSINAFATPGGYILITRGMLEHMHSEAELAGVLAHEIGHVLKRHHLQAIQNYAKKGLLADLASIAVGSQRGGQLAQFAYAASKELYSRGLDQKDEFEADQLGIVIAARAGYDPYGLPAVLQTLSTINPEDGNFKLMFETHPSPQKRLELLDGLMAGNLERYAQQPVVAERFEGVVGGRL